MKQREEVGWGSIEGISRGCVRKSNRKRERKNRAEEEIKKKEREKRGEEGAQ